MPLQGEAYREYHRQYMRRVRAIASKAKKQVHQALGRPIAGAALISQAAGQVAQEVLSDALTQQGWTLERHVSKRIQLTEFKRVKEGENGEAIEAPDGDVQCRAMDAMDRMLERAGTIPTATQPTGGAGGLHYHLHLTELAQPECSIPALDAAPDADQRVIDAQVLDSSDDA